MSIRNWVACFLFCYCAFWRPATAAIVTVDFEGVAQGSFFENVTVDGFRFSPYSHIDIFTPQNYPDADGTAIGFDNSGIHGNADYLGLPPSNFTVTGLYIDNFSHPFSLLGFDQFELGSHVTLLSSNGGSLQLTTDPLDDVLHVPLSGPDWQDITWIQIFTPDVGAPFWVFDNFTFRVPEPSTGALLFGAAAALFALRRRPIPVHLRA